MKQLTTGRQKNVLDEIQVKGHDQDFEPKPASEPDDNMPQSKGRIETLRRRVERGEELRHPNDRVDYDD
jgi:hypothetical protein